MLFDILTVSFCFLGTTHNFVPNMIFSNFPSHYLVEDVCQTQRQETETLFAYIEYTHSYRAPLECMSMYVQG